MKLYRGVRIYETLPEIVDPAHTCLVIWDVQNGLVKRAFDREVYVARLAPFVAALRHRMTVVYTRIAPMPLSAQSGWNLYAMMRRLHIDDPEKLGEFMPIGSTDREIPQALAPEPDDLVIEKATQNIFVGTNFEMIMRNRGVQSLIFTGIATEIGVETSARDAGARGFYPIVLSDGVSSMDRESHERSLQSLSRVGIIASMAEILAALGTQ